MRSALHSATGAGCPMVANRRVKKGRRMGVITTERSDAFAPFSFCDGPSFPKGLGKKSGGKKPKKNPAPTFRSGINLTKLSLDAWLAPNSL